MSVSTAFDVWLFNAIGIAHAEANAGVDLEP
jgi:hypothetical protein